MPELYPGQAEVVAGKLRELELLQAADEESLKTVTDPERRAALLSRLAGRIGQITSQRRFHEKLTGEAEDRSQVVRLRLTPAERAQMDSDAAEAGQTLSAYIRGKCGL